MKDPKNLSSLLQQFFTEYLVNQRRASGHTIASYRDSFCLLLKYAKDQLKKSPVDMQLGDLDARFISDFLTHLEKDRGLCARSRNQRLAAFRSFFRYISLYVPERIDLIQQVLAIPSKRYEKKLVTFLNRDEIDSLLEAPDRKTWIGRREYALLMVMIQTGLRVSELTGLRRQDVVLGLGSYIRCTGKGRKERCTPLMKEMTTILKAWLMERDYQPIDPVFPGTRGGALSTDAVQYLLAKHSATAQLRCHSLKRKRISPHVLRHTAAIQLLQAGVDRSMIALWLGHESVETTQIYLEADIDMKEKILEKITPFRTRKGRYKADDQLLDFLRAL
jgi:integrase/recombinase XerD